MSPTSPSGTKRRRPCVRAIPTLLSALLLSAALVLAGCGERGSAGARPAADAEAGTPPSASAADLPACDPDHGGLALPDGFCALVVADDVGKARHLVAAPNGDLFVAQGGGQGGVVALRDTTADGRADVRVHFGEGPGTGIALRDGWLYFGADGRVVRWPMEEGALEPSGSAQTIVEGLPAHYHAAKSLAFDDRGHVYVNIGSPSNSCQERDRVKGSPGIDPCPQLETRAGIWRFDADRQGQTEADGTRFATGLRNTVALARNPIDGELYGVVHGRDQLYQNWQQYFTAEESAVLPAEKFVRLHEGDDYGWPYCFWNELEGRWILNPEYGGDGEKQGRCADLAREPLIGFPGHWAPDGLLFYAGSQFPERFHGGAFIAFHGSWNRAPEPQAGYRVVFVPFRDGSPVASDTSTFADGFAGGDVGPGSADHRPVGLAQGPDGSLFVSDDQAGTIWRVVYRGSGSGR
ncbi:MAG TPA: PQQ-dependent sugar dehydrogenase [Gemmatimonadota bacterium]|nr:PQQ-dependent sugar dehydrogenase [Gemmatimonadota bacterium]